MHQKRLMAAVVALMLVAGVAAANAGSRAAEAARGAGLPAGTEIIELRDAYSKHFSNGDGTIRAEIYAGAIHRLDGLGRWVPISGETDETGNVSPLDEEYWSGYTDGTVKTDGTLRCGTQGTPGVDDQRAWCKFDLSGLPDGTVVSDAVIWWHQSDASPVRPDCAFREVSTDPVAAGVSTLYSEISSGTVFVPVFTPSSGGPMWFYKSLNNDGVTAINDGLGAGWFAVGMNPEETKKKRWFEAHGHDNAAYKPYVVLTYTGPAPDPPQVDAILQPLAGEVWEVGSSKLVSWTLSGGTPDNILVEFSSDGGSTWADLYNGVSKTTHTWNPVAAPGSDPDAARIRVTATNTGGSDSRTVSFTLLGIPALSSPGNGAVSVPVTGDLDWDPTKGVAPAAAYDIYLDQNNPPTTLRGTVDDQTTIYSYSAYVTQGQTYHWQIVAKNGAVTNASEVRSFTTEQDPADFDLTAPADDAIDQPITGINFAWEDASPTDALSYELYLVPAPGDPRSSVAVVTGLATNNWVYDLADLGYSTEYNWDVKAILEGDAEKWSSGTFSFTTEVEPELPDFDLTAPADDAIDQPVTGINFTWEDASPTDALSYELYLVPAPGNPRTSAAVVTGLATNNWVYDLADLGYGTEYNWDVKAVLDGEAERWSNGTFSFTTEGEPGPLDFDLMTPAYEAIDQPITGIDFTWEDASPTDALSYELHLVRFPGDPRLSPATKTGLATNNWTYDLAALDYGTKYNWDVKAILDGSAEKWSTVTFCFTTEAEPEPPPEPPILSSPANGSSANRTPTLVVEAVSGATHYEFEVYDSETDALVTSSGPVGTNSWAVDPALVVGNTYWWQARVEVGADNWSVYSSRWNFLVVLTEPPTPVWPENGSDVATRTPTLWVVQVVGATHYEFEVYDSETDALVASSGPVTIRDWVVNPALEVGVTYWWQARVEVDGDWSSFFSPRRSFTVIRTPGWTLMSEMPNTPTARPVKYGGWLAKGPDATDDAEVIYAAKGYKTTDFYKYNPAEGDTGTWHALDSIPAGEEYKPGKIKTKPGKKGCKGVSDGSEAVYMTRGANMLGFYRYDIGADTWGRMKDVPYGPSGKRVKYGNDMVYVFTEDTGWIYLLKGYKTEFFRYNTVSGEWDTTLPEVPWSVAPKYKNGSFLVYDGDNTIYAHQSRYYDKLSPRLHHNMFKYDIAANTWDTVTGMPVYCLEKGSDNKKKKSKDGACGAWYDGNMYALKGGNTQGFYKYYPDEDLWIQLRQDTLPQITWYNGRLKGKRVKQGGDIVHYGDGVFYALKGNKTSQLWRWYVRPDEFGRPARPGVMAGNAGDKFEVRTSKFEVFPNPIANGIATLKMSGQAAEWSSGLVRVFDIAGRCVLTRPLGHSTTGPLLLDCRRLSSGVYLVRLDADSYSTTQKLVVQE